MTRAYFFFGSLFVFLIASSFFAYAIEYYADLSINVLSDGTLSITGNSNVPSILNETTPVYTSKQGAYWLLNLSFPYTLSEYYYHLDLPQGASINYLKTSSPSRIDSSKNRLSVIGTGINETLSIIVQYQINPIQNQYISLIAWLSGTVFVIILIYLFFVNRLSRVYRASLRSPQTPVKSRYNVNLLTEREREVMSVLEKENKPITQSFIQKNTSLPKASLSRTIDSLIRKDILEKKPYGMTNLLYFKEKN